MTQFGGKLRDQSTTIVTVEETVVNAGVQRGGDAPEASFAAKGNMSTRSFKRVSSIRHMFEYVDPDVNAIYTPGAGENIDDVIERCLTGVLDCQPAIQAMIDDSTAIRGRTWTLPEGDLRIDSTIKIRRQGKLCGQGGSGWYAATRLLPHTKTFTAITINRVTTSGDGKQGDWSTLEDFTIEYASDPLVRASGHTYVAGDVVVAPTTNPNHLCAFVCSVGGVSASGGGVAAVLSNMQAAIEGGTVTDGGVTWVATVISCIRTFSRAFVEHLWLYRAPGNAVTIAADALATPSTNANNFWMEKLRIDSCGANGAYLAGGDTNAGGSLLVDVNAAGYWGLYDGSFLGNSHYSFSAAQCGLGPYKTDNPNARVMFIGPYTEGGQPAASIVVPAQSIGGTNGAGFDATSPRCEGNVFSPTVGVRTHQAGSGFVDAQLGEAGGNSHETVFLAEAFDGGNVLISGTTLRLRYKSGGYGQGFYRVDLSDSDSLIALMIATANNIVGLPAGALSALGGLQIGAPAGGVSYSAAPYHSSGAAAPSSGTYKVGDFVWNTSPSELGSPGSKYVIIGWWCSGAPHTFKEARFLTGG